MGRGKLNPLSKILIHKINIRFDFELEYLLEYLAKLHTPLHRPFAFNLTTDCIGIDQLAS